jgi:hypothetical protein
MKDRAFLLFYARVMLREAVARRHQRQFAHWCLNSAIRATNEAAQQRQSQTELF